MITGSFEGRVQVPFHMDVGFELRVAGLDARRVHLVDSIAVHAAFSEEAFRLLRIGFIFYPICAPCHDMGEGSASLYFLAMLILHKSGESARPHAENSSLCTDTHI